MKYTEYNLFEEIHSIYTSVLLNTNKGTHMSVTTSDPEIFVDNSVFWMFMEPQRWKINVIFDPINHTVYQLDVLDIQNYAHHRWVNSKFKKEFDNNRFERMLEPMLEPITHSAYGKINYVGDHELDVLMMTARDLVEGITHNDDGTVNIPLDLTDEEFLKIARAAHELDITINEFMVRAVENKLKEEGVM